jgi:Xaa-Pro aminopeptidase
MNKRLLFAALFLLLLPGLFSELNAALEYTPEEFANRRLALMNSVGDGLIILFASPGQAGAGLYFSEKNLGIRIEDTVLITREGCEVLTSEVPKEIEEIEALLAKRKF